MKTHLGQAYSFRQMGQRANQEDSRFPDLDIPDKGQRFFVVCDGVGGSAKGEVASGIVCSSFGKSLRGTDWADSVLDNDTFGLALDAAYDALDEASDSSNAGMATTLTFVCVHRGGCTMAHIGDSRIYHVRPGKGILYRSDDHSLVNSMVHSGLITPEEAVNHPQSNVITRCMEAVEEDRNRSMATVTVTTDIQAGDYFFLCSDGVLHCISDDDLVKILERETGDEEKLTVIAERSAESTDNNTAILIPVISVEEEEGENADEDPESGDSGDAPSVTHRMTGGRQVTTEVASLQKPMKSSRIVRAFKRILGI